MVKDLRALVTTVGQAVSQSRPFRQRRLQAQSTIVDLQIALQGRVAAYTKSGDDAALEGALALLSRMWNDAVPSSAEHVDVREEEVTAAIEALRAGGLAIPDSVHQSAIDTLERAWALSHPSILAAWTGVELGRRS